MSELSSAAATTPAIALPESEWQGRAAAHVHRVEAWITPHQARAARGERHPVYDFLFDYYAFRPSWLRRWHPGIGVVLLGDSARSFLRWPQYRTTDEGNGVIADLARLSPARRESITWLRDLFIIMEERTPFFACFGLHEWAMVYRQSEQERRHARWPLRFNGDDLAAIVESLPLRCTHFDAFRFFTPAARPLNRLALTRAETSLYEQRGCLHANMDLYKWAFKLAPYTPSELVADCFALARDIREVDMRASPYDFSALGFAAIPVETGAGRAEYERLQREFTTRGEPLRKRLLTVCNQILDTS